MKEDLIGYTVIGIIVVLVVFMCYLDYKFPTEQKEEKEHKCSIFIKYKEHYQVTPLTWYYRDSFKCTECGRDYKK